MTDYLNTFIFKGKEYNVGSIVKLKGTMGNVAMLKRHYIDDCGNHKYDMIRLNNNTSINVKINNLDKFIVDVIEEANMPLENKEEYFKDTEVDVMFYGWVTYIVIMVFCLILNEWLFGVIATSFIFFKWRKKELKKD